MYKLPLPTFKAGAASCTKRGHQTTLLYTLAFVKRSMAASTLTIRRRRSATASARATATASTSWRASRSLSASRPTPSSKPVPRRSTAWLASTSAASMSHEDGAVGAWAAKAISTEGTVSRNVTGAYDGQRAKLWGYQGVPADIKSQAVNHKVKTVSLVTTYEELEDALANGYPAHQSAHRTRDSPRTR